MIIPNQSEEPIHPSYIISITEKASAIFFSLVT